jgi:beta-glucanase (GH16 family)
MVMALPNVNGSKSGGMKSRAYPSTLIVAASIFLSACGGGNMMIPPPSTYTIGGSVSGLSGMGLVLQNNGGDNLPVNANGTFMFSTPVVSGGSYDATVFLQPSSPSQSCTVTNSSGTAITTIKDVRVSCTTSQACSGVPAITTGSVTWSPKWCQEFNGSANLPDSTVWSFDLGNNNGWGNNEVEVYCGPPGYPNNPSQCPTAFSTTTNTVYIDGNGHLVIQPIESNGTWFSARMKTQGVENFQYGLIEASLQIPDTTNQGLWPAFWSLGSDYPQTPWPDCGEADFMENWSPQVYGGPGPSGNRSTIHTAKTGGAGIGQAYIFLAGQQADTDFHTYGIIWSANMMAFFVDDPSAPFFIVTPNDLPPGDTWPFNADIFLLMNVAVGGTLGGSTSGLTNPQPMMEDYVRWYTPSAPAAHAKPDLGKPEPVTVNAGATASIVFTPRLAYGSGFVYLTCRVDAPGASCEVTTNDSLNSHVINSNAEESVRVTITTSKQGTPFGDYEVTIYAFDGSNSGNGSRGSADASIAVPLIVKE